MRNLLAEKINIEINKIKTLASLISLTIFCISLLSFSFANKDFFVATISSTILFVITWFISVFFTSSFIDKKYIPMTQKHMISMEDIDKKQNI